VVISKQDNTVVGVIEMSQDNQGTTDMNRRTFLKVGITTGSTILGTTMFRQSASAEKRQMLPQGHWVDTCCHMCGGGTGIRVQVIDGIAYKIEPNPENPLGVCNVSQEYPEEKEKGASVCPRGNAGIMALYDPDRLQKPLRRTNPNKGKAVDPKWEEISWDTALKELTNRLQGLRDEGQPEALVTFSESSIATGIQQDFGKLFGTPNVSFHTNLCSAGRKAAARSVMGVSEPLGDLANTSYMLIFGWNPMSAIKWAHLPRIILKGIERGARLVVLDPRRSQTAATADEWLAIKPGTDGAFALAMAHVIIREELYNKKFVQEWTVGFDSYAKYVSDKTPGWAAEITGIPADTITRIAREFALSQPSIADGWIGPGQHSNAVQSLRAIFLLNVLVGNVDQPGGMMLPEKGKWGLSPFKHFEHNKLRFDGLERYPMGHPSGVYVETMKKLKDGTGPYPLKVGIATMTNLAMSVPATAMVIDALTKLEYFVVIDNYMTETALLADLVLPGTTYLERYGLVSRGITWPIIALRQPVVSPLFNQLPEYDVFIELGRRLGLTDATSNEVFADLTYEDYMDMRLRSSPAAITLDELKNLPGAVWKDTRGTRYLKFQEEVEAEKYTEIKEVGNQVLCLEDGQYRPMGIRMGDGNVVAGIDTPSRKFEFVSGFLEGKKDATQKPVQGLPFYTSRKWMPNQEYPLYLISWKEVSHTHSRTSNNPYLLGIKNDNPLMLNRRTAEKLGIKDGDNIWIESAFARSRGKAQLTEKIHPEVVGCQWGFGHWAFGGYAEGKGINMSQFNFLNVDPISGQALHKEVCVKVYKAQ